MASEGVTSTAEDRVISPGWRRVFIAACVARPLASLRGRTRGVGDGCDEIGCDRVACNEEPTSAFRRRCDLWRCVVMRVGLAALVAALMLSGCALGGEEPLEPRVLQVATGNSQGVYARYGDGLTRAIGAHVPRLSATVRHTDGSIQNLQLLAAGRVDIAFALADSAADARAGSGRFRRPVDVVALARLYDNYVQVIVRDDSDIRTLQDLSGKLVSVGARGSGTALIAERVLAVAGLQGRRGPRRRPLAIDDSARALAAGDLDALFWSGGLPTEAIRRLQQAGVRIRLLDLSGIAAKLRGKYRIDVYKEANVPRRAYRLPVAVRTVSVPNLLVVRGDLRDEVAYRLTRLLFARHDELRGSHAEARRLNPRSGIATYPLPRHPAAQRWYDENRP